jgi:hypothetical protein
MVFSSGWKKVMGNLHVSIDGKGVKKVDSIKFLGVMIDCNLNWKKHIFHIKSKVSKGIGIICKARKYLSKQVLISLYYSFIYPYLSYCIEVWGSAGITCINSLFVLQKKTIRILASRPPRENSAPIFKSLKILTIHKIYSYRLGLFMFNIVKMNYSAHLFQLFQTRYPHDHHTRNINIFTLPVCRTKLAQTGIRYTGVKIWHNISPVINTQCSVHTFKKRLKRALTTDVLI